MALRWLAEALADLCGIRGYIAKENPVAAQQVLIAIRQEVDTLRTHPAIGRPGRLENTRELVISHYPYIVAYRESGRDVHILAVVHTSRRWPDDDLINRSMRKMREVGIG